MTGNYPAGVTDNDPHFLDESKPEDEKEISFRSRPLLEDRALDAQIAEFMGWTPIPHEDGWQSSDGQQKHWPGPPNYSTEIKAAMEVLEKADGLWTLTRYLYRLDSADEDTPYELKYSCNLRFGDNTGGATADTKERAICLAALKAIDEQVPRTENRSCRDRI